MRIVSLAILLSLSTIASAQPGLTPPLLASEQAPPSVQPLPRLARTPKNRDTAYLLSSVGALLPIGIFMAGVHSDNNAGTVILLSSGAAIFAPAAGHWYAERFWTTGTGIRMIGVTVSGLALMRAVASDDCACEGTEKVFFAGLGVVAIGALWDIATAGDAVDDWNRKHAMPLTPTVMKTGSGYGFGLAGSF
jgi:hypothetical protein